MDDPAGLDEHHATSGKLVDDQTSLEAWVIFLHEYANGRGLEDPPRPMLTRELQGVLESVIDKRHSWVSTARPLYTSTTIDHDSARTIRTFYAGHAFLLPPRSPHEALRDRCIEEYDLCSPRQVANMQTVVDLVSAFSPGSLATFSLFQDGDQVHYALAGSSESLGRFGLVKGVRIPPEDSLCGHAVLGKVLFVPDMSSDWRFRLHPFARAGCKSYIGTTVTLPTDMLGAGGDGQESAGEHEVKSSHERDRIGIGTLNIYFVEQPCKDMSEQQCMVVKNLTLMLETQLWATWEGHRRTKEAKTRIALAEFLEEALIKGEEGVQEDLSVRALERMMGGVAEIESMRIINTQGVSRAAGWRLISSCKSRSISLGCRPSRGVERAHLLIRLYPS
jgi:hypothetical protein